MVKKKKEGKIIMSLEKYCLKMPKTVYSGKNSMEYIPTILKINEVKKVALFTDKVISVSSTER